MTQQIRETLFRLQDLEYQAFQSKLMPTVDPSVIIGVRTPQLRALAKQLRGTPDREAFLAELPHRYYEENNLHAFLLEQEKDPAQCLARLEVFLPHVDNWATCDCMRPKCLTRSPELLLEAAKRWLRSDHTYTIRYGIGVLLSWFLEERFSPEYLQLVGSIHSEEYYVNMMIAWYFATALAKQWDAALPWLQEYRLPEWVHRKTIRKAIESFRITREQKAYLRQL